MRSHWMQTNNKLIVILIKFEDDVIFNIFLYFFYIYNFICIITYKWDVNISMKFLEN